MAKERIFNPADFDDLKEIDFLKNGEMKPHYFKDKEFDSSFSKLMNQYDAIVFFDTETTGTDAYGVDSNNNPIQIIELAAMRMEKGADGEPVVTDAMDDFIKMNNAQKMPQEIIAFNEEHQTGINDDLLETKGVSEKEAADKFLEIIKSKKGKTLIVAQNAQFDLCMTYAMLERTHPKEKEILHECDVLDTLTVYKDRVPYQGFSTFQKEDYTLGKNTDQAIALQKAKSLTEEIDKNIKTHLKKIAFEKNNPGVNIDALRLEDYLEMKASGTITDQTAAALINKYRSAMNDVYEAQKNYNAKVQELKKGHRLECGVAFFSIGDYVKNSHLAIDDVKALYAFTRKLDEQRENLGDYINIIGVNSNFGRSGISHPNVAYCPQEYIEIGQGMRYGNTVADIVSNADTSANKIISSNNKMEAAKALVSFYMTFGEEFNNACSESYRKAQEGIFKTMQLKWKVLRHNKIISKDSIPEYSSLLSEIRNIDLQDYLKNANADVLKPLINIKCARVDVDKNGKEKYQVDMAKTRPYYKNPQLLLETPDDAVFIRNLAAADLIANGNTVLAKKMRDLLDVAGALDEESRKNMAWLSPETSYAAQSAKQIGESLGLLPHTPFLNPTKDIASSVISEINKENKEMSTIEKINASQNKEDVKPLNLDDVFEW